MATSVESVQVVPIKLDNSNYVHWASFMRNFFKGRNLWKYVTGDCKKPIVTSDTSSTKALEDWEINNSRAIALLASAVSPSISLQVGKFEFAADAWCFLEKRFVGTNFAQKYKLEMDIRSLRQGPSQYISDFFAQMSLLWDQLAVMDPKFAPLPSVETALSELLSEETRHQTGGPLGSSIPVTETVFAAAPRRSSSSSTPKSGQSRDMSRVQCNYCKEFGHMKFTCPKLKKSPPIAAAHSVLQLLPLLLSLHVLSPKSLLH
ncbi:hypothetical protein H6P81_013327 [Aristolochia fimbriata]|uniref:Retrotransposon Copia-like N-terminal domain-containing protein n=1 Tax=Aristolochia fimbriata TaxID=158543 RepID=A0AAV7EET1_ARIFI|nr:hypothetical protein H6P81_013327 [Aristolochia fimbriata]